MQYNTELVSLTRMSTASAMLLFNLFLRKADTQSVINI